MVNANRRLLLFLIVGFVASAWACGTTVPTPTSPRLDSDPSATSIASSAPASAAATLAGTSATPDVAATAFVVGLSPEQAAVFAAVQTQLPNEPARWLVAMNETLIAQPALTPTPLPFPVVTEVGQFGVRYRFADPADVEEVRNVYERYWDFISFRDGPPPENLAEVLAQYLAPSPKASFNNGECMYADVLGKIEDLRGRGVYLRLVLPRGIQWGGGDQDAWLIAGGVDAKSVRAEVRTTHMPDGVIELVDAVTGLTIRTTSVAIYLNPMVELVGQTNGWYLVRDGNGVYCEDIWQILSSDKFFER